MSKDQPRTSSIPVALRYFAILREQSGIAEEMLETVAPTAIDLYRELQGKYKFTLPADRVAVAINGSFSPSDRALAPGDSVVFIPPVAGG
jgi:molybdopterin converting factor small subunit